MIQALLKRAKFEYELTFFDYNKEVGNRERAEKYFGEYGISFRECNDLDYRISSRNDAVWEHISYNHYTETSCDIYHFMNIVSLPLSITGKVIVTAHDFNWRTYNKALSDHARSLCDKGLERLNILQPEIIAISQSTKNELLEYSNIPEEKINVVLQSYDERNLYPDPDYPKEIVDGNYLLFIGTIESKKNVTLIADAFFTIADRYPDLRLVIVGKPTWEDMSSFYKMVDESKFRDRVILPGYVDVTVKRKLYSHARCFLFPSICEGWGNPILEAMACGCPVITSNVTAMPEAGGDAALYISGNDPELLVEKIDAVLASDGIRNTMIRKGLEHSRLFSWDKTASEVESVYRKVLGQ